MKYRELGRTGRQVSALGFGTMRLPTRGSDSQIDERAAIALIRYAIDQGINYLDTAYVYHGGASEVVVGEALQFGYRQRARIATKLPIWMVQGRADCDKILKEQLRRLRTRHIDCYLLHCVEQKGWQKMQQLRVLDWLRRVQREGSIGSIGFSFHDNVELFRDVVNAFDWDFCQIQYNFVNEDVQAGREGLKFAAARGLGVVIMEPLFGGTLANPPQLIWELWQESGCKPADLALRWLWDQPEVSLVLSGMSALNQLQENIASACRSGIGWLEEEERALLRRVRQKYQQLSPIPCTRCGYCLPCPNGVNVPLNFELYNEANVFKGNSVTLCRNLYGNLSAEERAGACQTCGACDDRCPQGIDIPRRLSEVSSLFA